MNKIKRLSSMVLCVLLLLGMLSVCQFSIAFAATQGDFTYEIVDEAATVTGYTGTAEVVVVPEKLGDYYVSAIGDNALKGNATVKEIALPDIITSIGNSAFQECTALESISMPDELVTVGDGAFLDCAALKSVAFGKNVTAIGVAALSGCAALEELTVPFVGCTKVGSTLDMLFDASASAKAGYPKGLKKITVTADDSIDAKAFKGLASVTEINWLTAPTSVGISAFEGCTKLATLAVSFDQLQVISEKAFYGCEALTTVSLPNQLTTVGASAFEGCAALADIFVTDALKEVGKDAFKGTAWLKAQADGNVVLGKVYITFKGEGEAVVLPASVLYVAESALEGNTAVKEVVIPDNITYIGANALKNTKPVKITVPYVGYAIDAGSASVSYLFGGASAADNATLLPSSLKTVEVTAATNISADSFANCAYITTVAIPETVTAISEGAFKNCAKLKTLKYDAASATVEQYAFAGSPVSEIVFGDHVKVIPTYLATSNANLTKVTISPSVTEIQTRAFAGCYNVKELLFNAANCTSIADNAFEYCHKLDTIVIGEAVEHIPANLYSRYGGSTLKEITIPANIKSIAPAAFALCTALETVYFNAEGCEIGKGAFSACENLKNIVLGENVETIPANLYSNSAYITTVTIPEQIKHVDDYAFENCTALETVNVPDTLLSIGQNTMDGTKWYDMQADGLIYFGNIFYGYKGSVPTSITLKNGTLALADGVLNSNKKVESIFIPNSVTYFGKDAFTDSTVTITCYASATHVIDYANANNITLVTLPCADANVYFEIVTEATANSSGVVNKICKDCGQLLGQETYTTSADLADEWVLTTAPTCTQPGVITKGDATAPIAATGHGSKVWKETKKATCAEEGEKCEFCIDCGIQLAGKETIKKLPHTAGVWTLVKQPKTYCEGLNAVLCTECGEILRSKAIAKLEVPAGMMANLMDVTAEDWYYNTVEFVLANNLFNGVASVDGVTTEFAPKETMTRAMFVTVLGRMAGVEVNNNIKTKFTDVKSGQYYTGYLAWASANGIVNGMTKTTFAPNAAITREQICTMIVRFCNYSGIDLGSTKGVELFRDADDISAYALESVMLCQKAKLVRGRGDRYFAPKDNATRAEVAQILKNLALGYFAD